MKKMLMLVALLGVAGCGDAAPEVHAAQVDTIRPPEEALERFREGLPRVDSLAGGAASLDALVSGFVEAVARRDTVAVRGMTLDRAEYAWIYFPTLQRMNPSTRMQPDVMWLLHQQESEKGITRVFRRLGGGEVRLGAWACEDAPRTEGGNRYWDSCTINVGAPGGEAAALKLFGSVIERGGRYKIVSYANDF